jgi:predicted alpha-1,2-mannosidase
MTNIQPRSLLRAVCAVGLTAGATIATPAVGTNHSMAATDFYSSFEAGDPQPDWVNTSEVDAAGNKKTFGVTGSPVTGIPGNITDRIVEVQANGENPPNELAVNVFDGNVNTKWLVFQPTGWVQGKLDEPVAVVHYALTSANDAPERDPRDWTLRGSQDGQTWTALDTQTDQLFDSRFQTKEYRFENTTPYLYYRLDITRNRSGGTTTIVQLAELQLSDGDTTPPPPTDMKAFVTGGPVNGFNHRPNVGFTGMRSLQYSGGQLSDTRGYAYNKVFDVDISVGPTTELSYLIFPELTANDLDYPSSYAAVDLAFTDGTYLSELGALDQHNAVLSPQGQGASKTLYTDQWNYKVSRIGDVAAGKTIDRILVAYDSPTGVGLFNGWVDDIRIVGIPVHDTSDRLSDWVDTRRGTHSSGGYSRGNNFPATAVPHGFNFWTPMTNAGSTSWLYEYHRQNNAQNLPTVQALAVSHETSPWMGDRQTFQVMPSASTATPPDGNRSSRALAFRHENEVAKPHYYGVTFDNGIEAEMAPSDHAAMLRFTFTGNASTLIFDNVSNQAGLTIDQANGLVTGYSDVRSGLSTGATRMYMYATFDQPIIASGRPSNVGNRTNAAGWVRFDTSGDKIVTMRVATSLISVAQARHNLELEIAATDTFEAVTERAQQAWDDKLSVIEVEGANNDQLTTLYSNLYRLFLYPNSAFENIGSNDAPIYRHTVQSATSTPPSGPTETGAPVVDGKVYVNNGFWDTYRTTWPAYALLTPSMAGEMVNGFVQQYKDGGWIARWSSPGYANLMVGTSSDVAFADAYLKGVTNFDLAAAYDAAIKNATVSPPNQNIGRKGFSTSPFLGYTSVQSTDEAMSWAMDGYINDFGIANMARARYEESGQARYLEEHEYFINRARNYVNMFDPSVRFFQGRNADGTWRVPPEEFDPRIWGFDYTETNAWNMAFHVPQDGRGLANLYGGSDALAGKLDEFFATPETAGFPGSYGGIIHEMREARDVRMGQYGHSNQPSHHIPYMYDYAGQPWKTQANVREALSRLYIGSEIGQGYPGDEDNGEMSAWWVFSALGFYPLQMGSPYYAIGSPLFTKATVHLENGEDLVINAPANSPENVYVQGVTVNGQAYDKTYMPHDLLSGGAVLDFAMGPAPSQWGTGSDAAPPSITDDDDIARPLQDATGVGRGTATASGNTNVAGLFDNTSETRVSLTGSNPWVQYRFRDDSKQLVRFYTLTSGDGPAAGDPRSWVLSGSNDGSSWRVLDQRSHELFPSRLQTRPFKLAIPANYSRYRIEFIANGGGATTGLAEVELLTSGKVLTSPISAEVEGAVAWPGDEVNVRVVVSNSGAAPTSGEVAVTVPEGWSVTPASAPFERLVGGESATLTFAVKVPESTEPGAYEIVADVTSRRGGTSAFGVVRVIGDVIEFTPGTAAEVPWLFDADASQLDGEVYDGHARFTDGQRYVIYRFQLPAAVTGGTLTLDIGNQFLVKVSTDGETWRTVLEEPRNVRDLSNREARPLDLNELRGDSQVLYLWIGDSQTTDGWGAWLARLTLAMDGL